MLHSITSKIIKQVIEDEDEELVNETYEEFLAREYEEEGYVG